jgi:8-oxo-dGTP diphosphatase
MLTVDIVAVAPGAGGTEVLLIRRRHDPFAGAWALPGGFVDMDEELEACAAREFEEETGLKAGPLEQVGAFGAVGRDPRGRTVTVAFLARLDESLAPRAGDDAAEARWFQVDGLPRTAFDHADILRKALGSR